MNKIDDFTVLQDVTLLENFFTNAKRYSNLKDIDVKWLNIFKTNFEKEDIIIYEHECILLRRKLSDVSKYPYLESGKNSRIDKLRRTAFNLICDSEDIKTVNKNNMFCNESKCYLIIGYINIEDFFLAINKLKPKYIFIFPYYANEEIEDKYLNIFPIHNFYELKINDIVEKHIERIINNEKPKGYKNFNIL